MFLECDLEMYLTCVYVILLDLDVNISAEDLKYALQGIPELGQLSVSRTGDCKSFAWTIDWLTMPGNQPLLQVNMITIIEATVQLKYK